jgi:hypothetical protein
VAQAYAVLAALAVAAHLVFVGFAVLGGLLALRWPQVVWLQVPAAAWAAVVELTERVCPLTLLENELRRRAGLDPYSSDFAARYVLPLLYPDGLTRTTQFLIGLAVVGINLLVYGWAWRVRTKARSAR